MSAKEKLQALIAALPEERLQEVLDFAEFMHWQDERRDLQRIGRMQFARAFGPDEPEYALTDLKPESGQ